MVQGYYRVTENPSKDRADRYKDCKILTDKETGESLLATREIGDFYGTSSDTYHRLENHELNRLDMLAYKYYQNPGLWWVIAQANDIYDPFSEMVAGTLIRIPSLTTLYGNNGVLL